MATKYKKHQKIILPVKKQKLILVVLKIKHLLKGLPPHIHREPKKKKGNNANLKNKATKNPNKNKKIRLSIRNKVE